MLSTASSRAEYTPQIQVYTTLDQAGTVVAGEIVRLMRVAKESDRPFRLGLATGSAPLSVYRELRRLYETQDVDFSQVLCFNLDEYVGIGSQEAGSYYQYMQTHLYQGLMWTPQTPRGFREGNIFLPPAWPSTADEELALRAARYERLILESGPVDFQILGIGENGHIAFCEPGSPVNGKTSVVQLSENTRQANARFFDGDITRVPKHALSMGIGTILRARRIAVIASGVRKRDAVRRALREEITEMLPASLLRLHPHVTFVLDKEASEGL